MKYNKMKFICSNIFNGIGIFLFKGDPKSKAPSSYLMESFGAKKCSIRKVF